LRTGLTHRQGGRKRDRRVSGELQEISFLHENSREK
jgi:hypothetical protein